VLILVLRQVRQPVFKLASGKRSKLTRIEENQSAHETDAPRMFTRSEEFLGRSTVSSEQLVTSEVSDCSGHVPVRASTAPQANVPDEQMIPSELALVKNHQCLLPGYSLLLEDGTTMAAGDLTKGARLCTLTVGEGPDGLTFGSGVVRSIHVEKPREQDIVQITMSAVAGISLQLDVTSSHGILVTGSNSEWFPKDADELKSKQDRLFAMHRKVPFSEISYPMVEAVVTTVLSSQVVQVELEDPALAMLVQLTEGVFVAVFGSPELPNTEAVKKGGCLDVQLVGGNTPDVAQSVKSDQTHSRKSKSESECQVYRTIIRPHDKHCTAWCKFFFSPTGCKKMQLCEMCHDAEHQK